MGFLEGQNRNQPVIMALDDLVPENSMVRIIDRFVETVDLKRLGFANTEPAQNGRPSYSPSTMAKLYLYGFKKEISSSRGLEKQAHRNYEVMWLMNRLTPDHKTIAEFKRKNTEPLNELFREFAKQHNFT